MRLHNKWMVMFLAAIFILTISVKQEPIQAMDTQSRLKERLDQLIQQDPDLKGALAGISIRSQSSGEILYQHLGDVRLRPASNMKLLTAVAALSTLGKDYRFETEIRTDGEHKDGQLNGNLYLKGKGDPTLLRADFEAFAKRIKKKGINVVTGDVIGDDTWYDDTRYSIDLPWSDEETYYGAAISALTVAPNEDYDAGTVIVDVSPNKKINERPTIRLTPKTDLVKMINNARTVAGDQATDIVINRKHHTNTITIDGTIAQDDAGQRQWVAVQEPTRYALDMFKQSLERYGIKLKGEVRIGKTPSNTELLFVHRSMPLSELMIPFMKLSNNGHAEVLVKEMGKVLKGEGSWEKGLEAMATKLSELGVETSSLVLRDGSGISHVDLVPANEITKLLYHIQDQPWFSTYIQSLPVAGISEPLIGGTLRYRMTDKVTKGKVKAKTGSISTVSSLSGYLKARSGKRFVFSILLNNLVDEEKGKAIEDKIVGVLSEMK
ncbi:D-alanyl-D-alanine carboxypeptidase/D-alanyl-D-alanine-endopeptidase [Terrihalobacillus insolitus]|uniref:D-alanyl-D-alanine carboxypeptidase/D-alanyl-D-alanine endopeptidase n=1 Tax=Terrihalobacillus insolitus TaxID=2950438 RepID=UPI0023428451|nr:D-alanyl-D-alanine carboxypeptidase/D-alanyl-D-alanine-endopeptidase [Terrihalobacillus insolitus]MDC3414393.1 D-alanyl-D-alanine carboxypeptidase/D-alanyl-D-alanine-endopeptidase [Terrihalobacillus insolitus]